MQFDLFKWFRPTIPTYLIIGVQKAGTSSLQAWLSSQKEVAAPRKKELHYFTFFYHLGLNWYRRMLQPKRGKLNGEASPLYFFHPDVPARVADLNPKVKLIVLFREPAERAWSQYRMNVSRGEEPLEFAEALRVENQRIQTEAAAFPNARFTDGSAFQRYSYLNRGTYASQLKRWLEYFPLHRILLVKAEDLWANPQPELERVANFLGLEDPDYSTYQQVFAGEPEPLPALEASWIRELLAKEMKELNQITERQFY